MPRISSKPRVAMTMIEVLTGISVIGLLLALLVPAIMAVRLAAWNLQCQNNVRSIGMALIHHDSMYRRIPGTSTSSLNDWAIAILPGIEQTVLANQFRRGFNATDPVNIVPSRLKPHVYNCPNNPDIMSFMEEIYAGHYGLNNHLAERSLSSLANLSQTVLVGELPVGVAMPWITSPAIPHQEFSTCHQGSSTIGYADGHVVFSKRGKLYPENNQNSDP